MKFWTLLGKVVFWLTWPGLWLVFRWSRRTRLLLICGEEFLVLRGWLGTGGQWGLPGGGLHRNEQAVDGVLREVKEETGMLLTREQVSEAFEDVYREHGLRFRYYAFIAHIAQKPVMKPQPREIAAIEWQSLKNPQLPLTQDTKTILEWWLKKA